MPMKTKLTLEKIQAMDPTSKRKLRSNAESILGREPDDVNAQEVLAIFSQLEMNTSREAPRHRNGIKWTTFTAGSDVVTGYIDGRRFATIRKLVNHTHTNDDVYEVAELPKPRCFRYIKKARKAAEKYLLGQQE